MDFTYTAKNKIGATIRSVIDSDSLHNARQTLRREGLFVVSIEPAKATGFQKPRSSVSGGKRVRSSDLMMFMSQLTIMCQSGVDLSEALLNVTSQTQNEKLRKTLTSVSEEVINGKSFSEAIALHPHIFSSSFVAGITAGEQSGELVPVLERLTQLMRKDEKLRGTVKSMLMYPVMLCLITTLVFIALLFFVLPQFANVFADMEKPAPPLTQALLGLGTTLRNNLVLILISSVAGICAFLMLRRTSQFKHAKDRFLLHSVLCRKTTSSLVSGRLLRLLGTLLSSGVPLVDCIRLCRRSASNVLFQDLFERLENSVMQGEGLAKLLMEATFLPVGAAQMIKTAEKSGKLGTVLQTIGEYYEDEGERHLRDLVKVAEPAIIVVLGAVVAVIVLAVLIPLLDATTSPV